VTALRDVAYAQLHEAIVSGQLQPNERLVEADLSDQLGVSRSAIRGALLLLQQEGLVVRELNRGAKVRMITEEEAGQILDAREALEGVVVARQAALKATVTDGRDLEAILERMHSLLENGDLVALSDESAVLHERLLQIADHATVSQMIAKLKSQSVRFQFRTILAPGRPEAALAEHSAIVAAVSANDPDAAEAAMREHLAQIRTALLNDRQVGTGRTSSLMGV
jgi:DNA-binding GntR family transcriptional regulator